MKRKPKKTRVSITEIDRTILSLCKKHWLKVARVALQSMDIIKEHGFEFAGLDHQVNARIAALVRNGRLEAQGKLHIWRSSEVRLPAELRP